MICVNEHLPVLTSMIRTLKPRVLAHAQGSGPSGESSGSAFYTLERLPPILTSLGESLPATRSDIDLGAGSVAFTIDGILTDTEADALAACGEAILEFNGQSRMAPGITTPPGMRRNFAAHWFPLAPDAGAFFPALYARIKHLLPTSVGGEPLHDELNQKLALFRYNEDDRFERHSDGVFPGQGANERGDGVDAWVGTNSRLSMLLYLTDAGDGLRGGETRLWRLDGGGHVDVPPRKGSALFFQHGAGPGSVMHEGRPVEGAIPKYMTRMNVLYGRRQGTRPLY